MLRSILLCAVASTAVASLSAQNCFDTLVGTDLNLTDDSTAQALPLGFTFTYAGVAYTSICVCSNGYIWFGASSVSGGDYTPTEVELLTGAPRLCPLWCDLNPSATGSGHVYFNNTVPGIATVTWAGVYEYNSTNAIDMQVRFDAGNGITITYGNNPAMGATTTTNVIIGASPGGASVSNPVSFATRPVTFTQDNFAEVIPATGTAPIPYSAFQMAWLATAPGYSVADNTCTINSLPVPAVFESVGIGCPGFSGPALYEVFDTTGNVPDLSGLDLTFLPASATEFVALQGIFPAYFTGFSNNLNMTDDQSLAIALPFAFPYNGGVINDIYVSSNGFLTLGATDPGSGCCTGTPATLLAGPARLAGWWSDLYPPGGGGVYADLDAVSGDFVVSWDQVPEYSAGPPQTFQIALSPSGTFTFRWANVSTAGHDFLAGYSGGNGTPDPGQADVSAVNGTIVNATVTQPLVLTGTGPVVGGTFDCTVSNIASAPNGNLVLLFLSFESPPVPLDVLGMTGCTALLTLPELFSTLNLTLGSATTNFSVAIPNAPALYGLQVMSQALSDNNVNPLGFTLSNGGRLTFGL